MKRKTFLIIVTLTGLSLAGVIFIQFFWIRNAIALQEEQFDNCVLLSLKGVVNEMYECRNDTCEGSLFCVEECNHHRGHSRVTINQAYLDSLVHAEFSSMGLEEPYVYGIFNSQTQRTQLVSDTLFTQELLKTAHAVSLSCIYRNSEAQLGAWFPDEGRRALMNIVWWLILCFFLIGVLVFGLSYTIYSFVRQKKLSEMKSDFVNNMTHEFKTPIATISLASEMLLKPAVLASDAKTKKYAGIIYDENQRLRNQVEHILHLSVLDKEEFRLQKRSTDVHHMLQELVEQYRMLIKDKQGEIRYLPQSARPIVFADPMHLRNCLSNLIDNACKYSAGKPEVLVETETHSGGLVIIVEDKGIGISHENQKQVFKKLYRVPTGNVHDVKGFGLGLYYVKTMVEAHGGWIHLNSELHKGSRFELFVPYGDHSLSHETKDGQ